MNNLIIFFGVKLNEDLLLLLELSPYPALLMARRDTASEEIFKERLRFKIEMIIA